MTISIQCLWDNLRLHSEAGPPMYMLWRQNQPPSPLLKALLTDQTTLNRTYEFLFILFLFCKISNSFSFHPKNKVLFNKLYQHYDAMI